MDFAELCITSGAEVKITKQIEISAVANKAEGKSAPVCWKINKNGCERHPI